MVRGAAQPFRFKIPCNFGELSSVRITFSQDNYNGPDVTRPLPIIKVLSQCRAGSSSKELLVILNPEETLRFTDKRKAYVQMFGEVIDGLPFRSKIQTITVYPTLDDSIPDDDIIPTPDPDDDGRIIILDGLNIIQR